jgi:hypothetical protein
MLDKTLHEIYLFIYLCIVMKLHPQPMYWQFCKELTFKVEMTFDQNNLKLKMDQPWHMCLKVMQNVKFLNI